MAGQIGAAYPQAVLRPFDRATFPAGRSAQHGPDEVLMLATLQLRAGDHLPLRTLEDRDLDERTGSAQADPLLGLLGALADLPGRVACGCSTRGARSRATRLGAYPSIARHGIFDRSRTSTFRCRPVSFFLSACWVSLCSIYSDRAFPQPGIAAIG